MSDDTAESRLIHLLKSGVDIIECPAINQRLVFGFPATQPILWLDNNILDAETSEAYSEAAHNSEQIELRDFKGANGLTYYRYHLVNDSL